jgi:hypothetical protein
MRMSEPVSVSRGYSSDAANFVAQSGNERKLVALSSYAFIYKRNATLAASDNGKATAEVTNA